MQINYIATIDDPKNHLLKVLIKGEARPNTNELNFFLPSWSPGSYLMREYGRNVQKFKAQSSSGELLHYEQVDKGTWNVNFEKLPLKNPKNRSFEIEYEVYCHELTVRTSYIDEKHAFLHGPSIFMGILNQELCNPSLEVRFPPSWSKISTGLKDISKDREVFLYSAENYDNLIDSPLEIGCHETDGFLVKNIPHELAFFGECLEHNWPVKKDIQTIVEYISNVMGDIPYEKYTFITHFAPALYGGLEHGNSTALQFDGMKFADRKQYINWLALVSHEYFHTWNIKRIRPRELGPFNYLKEANTKMLWLAEGLTSFMDELFVLRTGLVTLEEYLDWQKKNLTRYFSIKGRRFHSLEDSSFNAWNKLYRPDENSKNSSISYYLKGGIVFFVLNQLFVEKGHYIDELLTLLWDRYKMDPKTGVTEAEVFEMVEKVGGKKIRDKFELMISTTEEIDLEQYLLNMGLELKFEEEEKASLGITPKYIGDRVFVAQVQLDEAAYKSGINAQDEILAVNGLRVTRDQYLEFENFLLPGKSYDFLVSRKNYLETVPVLLEKGPRSLKSIEVKDKEMVLKTLLKS